MKLKRFEDGKLEELEVMKTTVFERFTDFAFSSDDIIYATSPKKNRNRRYKYFMYAFLVILILTTSFIYYINFSGPKKSTFEKYYVENTISHPRSGVDKFDAIIKFQQKDFDSASYLFEKILKQDESNVTIKFYLGISNIETENYEKSIDLFKEIIENNDNLYVEHSTWYLGLCYLKIDDKEKATEQFQKLKSDPKGYYYKKSKSILKEIN